MTRTSRDTVHLRGTKIGCAEGGCGACTVMLSWIDIGTKRISHAAVNACLTPVCSVHGMAVTTVEGIGSTTTKLHPVQERIAKAHGSQCGFCTPGFVMSMYCLLRNNPEPSMDDIMRSLEGNLCRCTGYRPIIEGFRTFAAESTGGTCNSRTCCRRDMKKSSEEEGGKRQLSSTLFRATDFAPYDSSQDIIFPPELLVNVLGSDCRSHETVTKGLSEQECVVFAFNDINWFQPNTMAKLLHLKQVYPTAKLVMGNTEIGVEVKFKSQRYTALVNGRHVPELNELRMSDSGVHVGSAVTLSRLDRFLRSKIQELQAHKIRTVEAVVEMLKWFAGVQIRNVASIGGNITTASPISDLNPLLMAAGATLTIASVEGTREVRMDGAFFKSYRKIALEPNEILMSIHIPFTEINEHFHGFKQAQRKEDDIAIVNAGMMVRFRSEGSDVIDDIRLVFGGMAATTVMAVKTGEKLVGREWNRETLDLAMDTLLEDLPLQPGSPGGMEKYRQTLVLGFFLKFYMRVSRAVCKKEISPHGPSWPESWRSLDDDIESPQFRSTQLFQEALKSQAATDSVGRPVMVMSGELQASGEAVYVDDLPRNEGELFLSLVFSTRPHALIRSINFKDALSVDGVFGAVSADDIPGDNQFGSILHDESLFAEHEVHCVGQVVAGILAEDRHVAQRAAKLVRVEYEDLDHILTIEEAIAKGSYLVDPICYKNGHPDSAIQNADHVLEGEVKIGAQEHFYMETQCCLAIPKGEFGEMEIISSTQDVSHVQFVVAAALGIPSNRVVCKARRLGGAFGGKETRSCSYAAHAAVSALKSGRPVRLVLERDEDMISSGTRHPFLAKYKIGFSRGGKIQGAVIDLYANGGHSADLTPAVVNAACLKADNCYRLANVEISGNCCKTNITSSTAFRGFGAPQSMFIAETWMTQMAKICGLSQEKIREINFYSHGDPTHYNQTVTGSNLRRCWDACLTQSDFMERRQLVDDFNRENRWKKRGLAITPTKYGICFCGPTERFLNQAGALVLVYKDGNVLLTHGGCEMGQGLYTKMMQVASRTLGIALHKIHTSETSSDKVPNVSPTAASYGSDLNGMAVKAACDKIMKRLKPIVNSNPTGTWEDWVHEAYMARISLSATGFYRTPGLNYNKGTNEGRTYDYYCFGAGASEVEVDCLTGDHVVRRTDIVMDVGDSLNPAVDIGQVEGAFAQGYGLFLLEDYRMTPPGHLLTKGPGAYKMPSIGNTPGEFNVTLLEDSSNPRAICSSKAVGEPPLFLSASVFFAVRDAITSARHDAGLSTEFRLDIPAVPERIRLACQDHITQKIKEEAPGDVAPFFIRP